MQVSQRGVIAFLSEIEGGRRMWFLFSGTLFAKKQTTQSLAASFEGPNANPEARIENLCQANLAAECYFWQFCAGM
jgi:hypothetical protein